MARVPVPSGNLIERASRPSTALAAPDMTEGTRAIGDAAQRFGGEVVRYGEIQDAIDAELDQAAAKKADNAYAEWSRKRLWTDNGAFYQQEGFSAANARKPLEEEIRAKREEFIAGATTPRMRAMMQDALDRRIGADLEGIARHATAQFGVEAKRQSVARRENALNDAVTYYSDKTRFEQELEVGRSEVRSEGARIGAAPETVALEVKAFDSKVHASVASGMIRRGNIEDATAWVEEHRGSMTAADLEDLDAALYHPLLERRADAVVDDLLGYAPETTEGQTKVAQAVSAPRGGEGNLVGRMAGITAHAESRGRERYANGKLVTSPKGAQGKMQVMPGTNLDPGFGVTPARDGSDAERTRVGNDYLRAMMKRYGNDPAKAWAAYNWGPGNLDNALEKHGGNWLAHAPAETRAYVRGNVAALGGRGPAADLADAGQQDPREHDLGALLDRLDGMNLPFDLEQAARRQLTERVGLDERLLDRQRQQAVEAAESLLDAAERSGRPLTRESQIPASVWGRMGADQRMQVRSVLERNAAPAPRETDYKAYTRLSDLYASDPAAFVKLDPSSYRNSLSDGDYEKVVGWRQDVLKSANGQGGETHAKISSIRGVVSQVRAASGLTTTGIKEKDLGGRQAMERRIYKFETAVERQVELWQRANPGKSISDGTIREIAERQLTVTREKDGKSGFWFERSGKGGYRVSIPKSDVARLRAIGRRELGRDPTDLEISQAYLHEIGG